MLLRKSGILIPSRKFRLPVSGSKKSNTRRVQVQVFKKSMKDDLIVKTVCSLYYICLKRLLVELPFLVIILSSTNIAMPTTVLVAWDIISVILQSLKAGKLKKIMVEK